MLVHTVDPNMLVSATEGPLLGYKHLHKPKPAATDSHTSVWYMSLAGQKTYMVARSTPLCNLQDKVPGQVEDIAASQ